MKLILFGPPGSGKGTQAKLISKRLSIPIISTGDLIRKEIKKRSKFGLLAKKYNDKGLLVPDKYIIKFIEGTIKNKKGYILDGFPRDLKQAKEFSHKKIDKIIYISSSRNVIIKRLLKRARIEGRLDDTPGIIKERVLVYEKETKPLINYYKKNLIKINGDKGIKFVFNEILKKIKE